MVFKPDQQKMQQLLSEAITVLCKNGLNYQSHVNVEALIGITLDDDEVFLVSVKETIQSLKTQQVPLASPTYTTSPAHRQKATPNRKRTTPNAFQASHLSQPVNIVPSDHVVDDERVVDGGEPPAKRLAEVSDVIHIKGEQDEDGEEISETYLDQASANYEEAQDDGGGEQDRNYDTSQLEQFVDFATTSQSSEQDQVDSKAAVFPNQPVPDPTFAISPAIPISSSHQQLNSPATRTPQQRRVSLRQAARASKISDVASEKRPRTESTKDKDAHDSTDKKAKCTTLIKDAEIEEEKMVQEKGLSPSKVKTGKKIEVKPSGMITRRSSRKVGPVAVDDISASKESKDTDVPSSASSKAQNANEITIEIEIEKGKNNEVEEVVQDDTKNDVEPQSVLKEDIEETMHENVDRLLKSAKTVEYFKPFSCPVCNVTFKYKYPHLSKGKLKNHMKKHEGILYKCDECDKCFNNPVNLKNHKRGMHNKEFLCSECGKTFYNRPNLERHLAAIHWNVEERKLPYVCGECGKRFHNNKHLLGHQISDHQASEKRYKCETCGRSYVYEKSLKKHKCPPKVYTVEELQQMGFASSETAIAKEGDQFRCLICKGLFKTKPRAKMHSKMHFQEYYFNCEYCGKGFNGSGDLYAHINVIHHKQKEYMCYICGENRTFSYRRCVQEHMRNVHKLNWHIYTHKYRLDNNGHPLSEEQLLKMKQHEEAQTLMQRERQAVSLGDFALKQKVKLVDSALKEGDVRTPLEILATIGQGLMTAQEGQVQHFQLAEEVVQATIDGGQSADDVITSAASNIIPIAVQSAGIAVGQQAAAAEVEGATAGICEGQAFTTMEGEAVTLVHENGEEVVQEQYIAIDPQQGEILSVQTDPMDSNTIIIEYTNNEQQ